MIPGLRRPAGSGPGVYAVEREILAFAAGAGSRAPVTARYGQRTATPGSCPAMVRMRQPSPVITSV